MSIAAVKEYFHHVNKILDCDVTAMYSC